MAAFRSGPAGRKRSRSTPLGEIVVAVEMPTDSATARSLRLTQTSSVVQRWANRSQAVVARRIGPDTAWNDQACGW